MRKGSVIFVLLFLVLTFMGSAVASECTDCHESVTPKIVEDFRSGAMGDDLDCSNCHGSGHNSADDVENVKFPTHETCGACHDVQDTQYMEGKHSIAWAAMLAPPTTGDQPKELMEGQKGCGGCHKIGAKDETGWDEYEYGVVGCDNCHTRHSFSVEEARKPEACLPCHQGFDHPQWEMYSTSKHGVIYQTEGDTWDWSIPLGEANYTAPTCQLCHMKDGDHAVLTSWGFLGVRVEEPDEEWMADRISILKAYGVLDADGNPTERFDLVKNAKLARLTMDEWNAEREKMIGVCSQCHSEEFARNSLEESDHLLREADRIYAESIETVADLYRDGILPEPEYVNELPSYPYPDVLRFYDQATPIEEDLWLMWMEYRMRTFQGAFHANPDYAQWYGWAPLKETAVRIRAEDQRLRSEAEAHKTPGFGAAIAIAAMLGVVFYLRRRG
ncbi:MAG: cytochrome C [Candidatus Syntrophoarchaeum butanivorans]|uniref:Cytochrome C n=2 Tax=Candidatus Syntropharchaeum butanivorans TaxID=1839936 RepID=A0A1F2P4G4_9EURY|nr:MAG: cytochrome C [Candidatus Syntrophoarchaeum butanivorans]